MTKTVTIPLDENYKVIAESTNHNTATIQVRGDNSAEIIVDERTEVQRNTDGDEGGIIYAPLEITQYSGWAGEIRARAPHGDHTSEVTIILS